MIMPEQKIEVIDILTPVFSEAILLQQGAILFSNEVNQGVGQQAFFVGYSQLLGVADPLIEGNIKGDHISRVSVIELGFLLGATPGIGNLEFQCRKLPVRIIPRLTPDGLNTHDQIGKAEPCRGSCQGAIEIRFQAVFRVVTGVTKGCIGKIHVGGLTRAVVRESHERSALEIKGLPQGRGAGDRVQDDFMGPERIGGDRSRPG